MAAVIKPHTGKTTLAYVTLFTDRRMRRQGSRNDIVLQTKLHLHTLFTRLTDDIGVEAAVSMSYTGKVTLTNVTHLTDRRGKSLVRSHYISCTDIYTLTYAYSPD